MREQAEIGGYFELEMPDFGIESPQPGHFFQSARASIHAALGCGRFKRVLMPAYICDSIIQAGQEAGLEVEIYYLDTSLYPIDIHDRLTKDCAVLYVNYFGMCQANVQKIINEAQSGTVIIDNSHALFAAHEAGAVASAYSPRKFVGLPDGGILSVSSTFDVSLPVEEDSGSIDRMAYLFKRMAYSARAGYRDFDLARRSLGDTHPLRMSRLTKRLMRSIDWNNVRQRRRENYTLLAERLDRFNAFPWRMQADDVPLVYPFTVRGIAVDSWRNELAARDIFTATYWKDAIPRVFAGSVEAMLINETLFLPVDQRMTRADVEIVVDGVFEFIRR